MIKNLNRLTFAQFGNVLNHFQSDSSNYTISSCVPYDEQAPVFFCFEEQCVFLNRESGMPVLLVSNDELAQVHQFYLDKPVCLDMGIYFAVVFLGEDCRVKMALHGKNAPVHNRKSAAFLQRFSLLSPEINIRKIYTLFYQEREKGFFFPGERHDPYELVYVDRGKLHSVAGGKECLLQQGEMMIYPPRQWHVQYGEPDMPVTFIIISFDMDSPLESMLLNCKLTANNKERQYLADMVDEYEKGAYLFADMIHLLLKRLLLTLLRDLHHSSPSKRLVLSSAVTRENGMVESAMRYISENLDRKITASDVSQSINISASYLSMLFRKNTNMSLGKYIASAKLWKSKEIIHEGKSNIAEISRLLGYATPQHFSRCFKQAFGVTPSEYSKAIK